MNMSQVTVLIANRLIRLTGNIFKILAYPFHWVFPKLRFTIPAYSPAKLA
ncbi:glycosyl transferase, partial [Vibrio anguillarum]|nr:glycosyl transferase [Vibrio anguillarum]